MVESARLMPRLPLEVVLVWALFVLDARGVIHWSQTCPAAINPGVGGILTALETMGGEEANA